MCIDASRRNHTPYLNVLGLVVLLDAIDLHAVLAVGQLRALVERRRPAHLGDEVIVRTIHHLDALALLRQVPAADRLVVAARQQVLPARVEQQRPDPVVVAHQRLQQRAAPVPQLDRLVSAPRRHELRRAARRRRLLEAGQRGKMLVAGGRRDGHALDDVVVADELALLVAAGGVPEPRGLVVAAAEQPAAVGGGRHVADPVAVAAHRLDAVARRDVPQPQRAVARRARQQVPALRAARRPRRHEPHRAHAVVMPRQRPRVLVPVRRVPQLDRQVGAAARQQRSSARAAEVDVQHSLSVPFQCSLQLAQFPVPDLDCRVFGAGCQT